jgi:hypothetical protein
VYRLSTLVTLISLAAGAADAPVVPRPMTCAKDRFVAGERVLPSYDEALLQCREEERSMTHPDSGPFEARRACHDVSSPGTHGDWQYGRIAMDVVDRHSGDAYTFETLWMCKPM